MGGHDSPITKVFILFLSRYITEISHICPPKIFATVKAFQQLHSNWHEPAYAVPKSINIDESLASLLWSLMLLLIWKDIQMDLLHFN